MKAVYTTCPFCSCACGLYLQSDGGRLLGTAPSERHPVSHGRLCVRGWHAHEAPLWGERLTQPLVRHGGELRPASWPEAIRCAADQLKAAQVNGGVGVIGSGRATNEESYLAARLARGALKTPHVDCGLRDTYWPLRAGIARGIGGAPHGTLDEIAASDLLLVEEGDLARTHPQVAAVVVRALRNGARLVTLGPVRTQLARLAALHVPAPPGCHGELAAALLAAVVADANASAPDLEVAQLLASARNAGLPAPGAAIRQVARYFLEARRVGMLLAPVTAPPEEMRAAAYAWTLATRAAGHAGRPGSLVLPLPVRWNLAGACRMGMAPDALPGGCDLAEGTARERLAQIWATEPAWGEGLCAGAMLARLGGLLVVAEELATAMPELPDDALGRLKALIVLDAFATPTALAASVVLPVTSLAETDGTAINLEGRIQHVQAAVPPAGEARPGWEVLAELTSELGLATRYASVAEVGAEIARCVPNLELGDEPPPTPTTIPGAALVGQSVQPEYPFTLALDGVMDWGKDPLVTFSPTLRRDFLAEAKRFPRGAVTLNQADADEFGIRAMASVSVSSATATAVLPAVVRSDLERGCVLVPFAHRAQVAELLGSRAAVAVNVARA